MDSINLADRFNMLEEFSNNVWMKKYLKLIEDNSNTPNIRFITQAHHIIPKSYFKLKNLVVDETKDNLVNLFREDHILAHYYLCLFVTNSELLKKLSYAFYLMTREYYKDISEDELILKFPELRKLYEEYLNRVKDIDFKPNSGSWKKGHVTWNIGLTKENNLVVKKISDSLTGRKLSPDHVMSIKLAWENKSAEEKKEQTKKALQTKFERYGTYGANNCKKFSDETREKMSKSMKGLHTGKIWVTNNIETKRIPKDLLNSYIELGFVEGRKVNDKIFTSPTKGKKMSEDVKAKLREAAKTRKRRDLTDDLRKKFSDGAKNAVISRLSSRDYYYYCVEDSKIFLTIAEIEKEYGISAYFIKKAIEVNTSLCNGKTIIKKYKEVL